MRILVGNAKGGVGKSTTAVQILAPFLVKLYAEAKVPLVEFDDENKDSETFRGSSILDARQIPIDGTDISSVITDIVLEHEVLIIDIGGNKTTTLLLDALERGGMINTFDIFVIPLMNGEQDAVNAVRIYKRIRTLSSSIRIVFALSKVDRAMDLEMQFFDFFGDSKNRINGVEGMIEEIAMEDRNIIEVHNSDTIMYSRIFGNTVYEISNKDMDALRKELAHSIKNKEDDLTRKLSYKMQILNKAIRYHKKTIEPCYKVLKG